MTGRTLADAGTVGLVALALLVPGDGDLATLCLCSHVLGMNVTLLSRLPLPLSRRWHARAQVGSLGTTVGMVAGLALATAGLVPSRALAVPAGLHGLLVAWLLAGDRPDPPPPGEHERAKGVRPALAPQP